MLQSIVRSSISSLTCASVDFLEMRSIKIARRFDILERTCCDSVAITYLIRSISLTGSIYGIIKDVKLYIVCVCCSLLYLIIIVMSI